MATLANKLKPVRPAAEVQSIREACQVAATVLRRLSDAVVAGMTTYDLDQLGRKEIAALGAESACFNYSAGDRRFPAHICISVNEEVVHGIGRLDRTLEEGDAVSIDVVVRYNGFIGDNATTVLLEPAAKEVVQLVSAARQSLDLAIEQARPGNRVGDISNAVERFIKKRGYGIVREFVGHAVGTSMHEPPQIPNFGRRGQGALLKPGMALAIEPMINLGRPEVHILDDGWTAVASDGKCSAHFEHTVLVTESDPEILTIPKI